MQQLIVALRQQLIAAQVQQPMTTHGHNGGVALVQNGADATSTVDAYPIGFLTQQFKDQVDDNGNGNVSDFFDEDKIDIRDNCGDDVEDDSDDERGSCLSVFRCFVVSCLVCVQFVSHFGISIGEATTHFLTGFGG